MKANTIKMIGLALSGLACVLAVTLQAQAQDAENTFPTSMAPLDQYLMDRDAEIAMARSAAPPSVAKDATVLVFGKNGYEVAVHGTNGFVCNVDRGWMDQFDNSPEFWNPKRRGPVCYNTQAAKTLLPITFIRTKLALAGKSKAEMNEGMKAAIASGELPPLEAGSMAYMLSKQGILNSRCGNCAPHLMFYVDVKDAATWGAAPLGADAPIWLATHFNGAPEPVTEFIVPVAEWSDGTPADSGDHAH
ncbi:MAG TPA: hypothetical protein VGL89_03945 [Candidatus Koribacter sp.]|jgi:hypothetical protein